jgi:acyl-CoA reductase-like NAD-dependent aldehyde dehydrogenase
VVKRMLSVKQMGAGQMCVCPDYVLCVEERLDEVLAKVKETYVCHDRFTRVHSAARVS